MAGWRVVVRVDRFYSEISAYVLSTQGIVLIVCVLYNSFFNCLFEFLETTVLQLIITVSTTPTTTLAELNGALVSMLREVFSSALALARTAMMDEIVSSPSEPPSSNRHSKVVLTITLM